MRASIVLSSEHKSGLLVIGTENSPGSSCNTGIDSCCWKQGWFQAWLLRGSDHVKRTQISSLSLFCPELCGLRHCVLLGNKMVAVARGPASLEGSSPVGKNKSTCLIA